MAVGLHMQAVYQRTRITGIEDVAVTTHDFWAPGAGDFTTAWMDAISTAFDVFIQGQHTGLNLAQQCRMTSCRFYDDYNGDGTPGEVDYIVTHTQTGGATQMLPPQVACSITELLGPDSRRHWGRFYLPGLSSNTLAADGSFVSGSVTAIADAAEVLYDAWTTADYHPIVWVAGTPGFNPVQVVQIRVDSIPDIIRRRRYQDVNLRVTRNIE